MPLSTRTRRRLRFVRTRLRELIGVVKGLLSTRHPLLVHIIPIRRCNLACTYCNEFDDFSKPVDLAEMFRRIDRLAEMGTAVITISGGEPLLLPEHAVFQVNSKSLLGSGVKNPEDALAVARRARALGFTSTVGILHDGQGQLKPLGTRETEIFEEIMGMGKRGFSRLNGFQHNIAKGKPNEWRCRSGSRYLYICEAGLVHGCSQQRGYPGIPLEKYTAEDRRREYFTKKHCAPRCTVSCVQQIAVVDNWRGPQTLKPVATPPSSSESLVQLTRAGSQKAVTGDS